MWSRLAIGIIVIFGRIGMDWGGFSTGIVHKVRSILVIAGGIGREVAIDGKGWVIGLFWSLWLVDLTGGLVLFLVGLKEYLAEGGLFGDLRGFLEVLLDHGVQVGSVCVIHKLAGDVTLIDFWSSMLAAGWAIGDVVDGHGFFLLGETLDDTYWFFMLDGFLRVILMVVVLVFLLMLFLVVVVLMLMIGLIVMGVLFLLLLRVLALVWVGIGLKVILFLFYELSLLLW